MSVPETIVCPGCGGDMGCDLCHGKLEVDLATGIYYLSQVLGAEQYSHAFDDVLGEIYGGVLNGSGEIDFDQVSELFSHLAELDPTYIEQALWFVAYIARKGENPPRHRVIEKIADIVYRQAYDQLSSASEYGKVTNGDEQDLPF